MDGQQLVGAPVELNTPRVVLHAPRPEFAPLFVESLNLSLPGLRYIVFAQQERSLEWGADFIARDRSVRFAGLVRCRWPAAARTAFRS